MQPFCEPLREDAGREEWHRMPMATLAFGSQEKDFAPAAISTVDDRRPDINSIPPGTGTLSRAVGQVTLVKVVEDREDFW